MITTDALAVGGDVLERNAGRAAQFVYRPLQHHAEPLAQEARVGITQLQGGGDAESNQLLGRAPRYAPQIGQLHATECQLLGRRRQQQSNAAGRRILLGRAVGGFGQRLGGRDADRDGNAGPLQHGGPQYPRMCLQPVLKAAQAEEGLVDRVDLQRGRELGQRAHDAGTHVAIKCVVAGADDDAIQGEALPVQVPGCAHFDPKGLCLI